MLAFSLRTVLGRKLLWYADVLAYIVRGPPLAAALVVDMFVGLSLEDWYFYQSAYDRYYLCGTMLLETQVLIIEVWFNYTPPIRT